MRDTYGDTMITLLDRQPIHWHEYPAPGPTSVVPWSCQRSRHTCMNYGVACDEGLPVSESVFGGSG